MKAIMYHYVRPFDHQLPDLRHLHFDDFQKQLDYFEETFGFVSRQQFLQSLKDGHPADGVVLTFDDGLRCHYDHVYPELKKRGLWGLFYIPTGVYVRHKLLDVHRIHVLLARIDSSELYDALLALVTDDILSDASRTEFRELTYKRQDNDTATNRVKRILNYYISYNHREQIIDHLMANFIPPQLHSVEDFYITNSQMREMHDNGMVIGSHTITHPVLSRLDRTSQFEEINGSFDYLQSICAALPVKTFCYPYGGFHSFTADTEKILDEINCHFSFNVEQRDIDRHDLSSRKQALPRYDCNQFMYGQVRV